MAGNTRGKLKEHFEGIHRNFDWSLHHINKALALIATQIKAQHETDNPPLDDSSITAIIESHPLYKGILALGEGMKTLDGLAQEVYIKL